MIFGIISNYPHQLGNYFQILQILNRFKLSLNADKEHVNKSISFGIING